MYDHIHHVETGFLHDLVLTRFVSILYIQPGMYLFWETVEYVCLSLSDVVYCCMCSEIKRVYKVNNKQVNQCQ